MFQKTRNLFRFDKNLHEYIQDIGQKSKALALVRLQ